MPDNIENVGVRAVVENLDRYVRDLKRMTTETDKVGREMQDTGKKAEGMGKGVIAAGLGFAAAQEGMRLLGSAARFTKAAFIDFEQGIANAGAVANATEGQMRQMTEAAQQIGRSTRFSAVEATGAFEAMAAAGIEVTDIINGGAEAAAALAAAGGVDLPMAADVMSTAMAVWGLTTDQAAEAANRLAGAANVSRFQVEDMALAVAQGGGAAAAAGVEFGDFTTAIAAIAPSFSSGSDAGTSFKTFLTRLNPESDKAREKLKELGIITEDGGNKFFDAAGNMKSMGEVAQLLHDTLGPLTEEQRLNALQVIFGTDAMRAAAGLMKVTRQEFDSMSRTMKETDAAEVAARRMDTLGGRVAFLKSTLETMAIDLGIKIAPALKGFVDGLISVAEHLDALPDSTKNLFLIGGGFTAMAAIAIPSMLKVVGGLKDLIAWMRQAENASKLQMAAGIGIAAAAVIGLDLALSKFTGHGLVATLTGAGAKADRMEQKMRDLNIQLDAFSTKADKVAFLLSEIAAAGEDFASVMDSDEANLRDFALATRDGRETAEALGKAMLDTGASAQELMLASVRLTGEMKDAFDATVDLEAVQRTYALQLEKEPPLIDSAAEKQREHTEALRAAKEETKHLAGEQEASTEAWRLYIEKVEAAEFGVDDLNEALGALIARFADANPAVIAAKTENAALREEIEDLRDASAQYRDRLDELNSKTGELTQAEKEEKESLEGIIKTYDDQIEPMQKVIDKNDLLIKGFDDDQEAVEAYQEAIEKLIGPEGFGAFQDSLAGSSLSLGDQQEATKDLAQAYVDLQGPGGIGAAIEGLGSLSSKLADQPEAWRLVAESLGPMFLEKVKEGVSDPAEQARLFFLLAELGINAGESFARGMLASSEAAEAAARTLGINAAEAAALSLGIGSPSKVFMEFGEAVAEGLSLGISEGSPMVQATLIGALDSMIVEVENSGLGEEAKAQAIATMEGFQAGIQEGTPPAAEAINAFVAEVGEAMDGLEEIVGEQTIHGLAVAFADGFDRSVFPEMERVIRRLDAIWTDAEPEFRDVMSRYVHVAIAEGDTLNDYLADLPGDVRGHVQRIAEEVLSGIPEVQLAFAHYADAIMDGLDPVNSQIFGLPESVRGSLADVAEKIIDAGPEAVAAFEAYVDAVVDEGDTLNDWLTHLPEEVRAPLKEIADVIITEAAEAEDAAEEFGEAIPEAIAEGVERRTPSLLDVLEDMGWAMERTIAPIADRIAAVADNAMTLMRRAFRDRSQEIRDEDELGRLGGRIMESLTVALETGSDRAFLRVGEFLANLQDAMNEGLPEDMVSSLMARALDALEIIIRSGGAEGVQAFRDILAEIQGLLDEAKTAADELSDVAGGAAAAGTIMSGKVISPEGEVVETVGAQVGPGGGAGSIAGTESGRPTEIFDMDGVRFEFRVNRASGRIEPYVRSIASLSPWRQINAEERGTGFVSDPEVWANRDQDTFTPGNRFRQKLYDLNEATQAAAQNVGAFAAGALRVPRTGMALVHQDEMILPATLAEVVRRALMHQARSFDRGGTESVRLAAASPGIAGADLVEIARAAAGPREMRSADGLGGGATWSLHFDFRGATMTGSLEENRRVMKQVAEDVLGDSLSRGAFLGGARR